MTLSRHLAREAGASARRSSLEFEKDSTLCASTPNQKVDEIAWESLQIGRLVGKGGFSNVNEVVIHDENGETEHVTVYAIKYLRNSVMQDEDTLRVGAADLAVEAKMLSHLSHPNIIKLHGISPGSLSNSYKHNHRFFLVLDLLSCSLEDKIAAWRFEQEQEVPPKKQNRILSRFGLSESQKIQLYERMQSVALPVAKALKYLHEHNIVLRDLKPGNIGFMRDGSIKLFDFGMAREIKNGRKLTGGTGSPLYMAPETMLHKSYGLPVDVYAMGYVLWELATLRTPFEGFTRDKHTEAILVDNARPKVDNRCGSARLQQLISDCWVRQAKDRPTASEVLSVLNFEVDRKLGKGGTYKGAQVSEHRRGSFVTRINSGRALAA